MDFPWLDRAAKATNDGHAQRCKVALDEVATRAGLMFRLGFSAEEATQRICQRLAWEFEGPSKGGQRRPAQLSDEAIAKVVTETYARRPG